MELPVLSCQGCGLCCHIQRRPPYMPTELDALPAKLLAEVVAVESVEEKGPCIWLTAEKQCGHYEQRPEVCRQFELGGEDCLAVRQEFRDKHGGSTK